MRMEGVCGHRGERCVLRLLVAAFVCIEFLAEAEVIGPFRDVGRAPPGGRGVLGVPSW